MTGIAPVVTLSPRDYDAVLFDLDGVLTKTASVYAAAWKRLFDGFLEQRAAAIGEPFAPFDIDADYRRYVDGKPRYDGVAAFLESRGIELPWGAPDDPPGTQTVQALGNLKDHYFTQHLEQHGVDIRVRARGGRGDGGADPDGAHRRDAERSSDRDHAAAKGTRPRWQTARHHRRRDCRRDDRDHYSRRTSSWSSG